MGLDKGLITYIHLYNVFQSIFAAYKNCSLFLSPPNLLATNDLIIISIVLLFFFSEWHILVIYFSFSVQSLYKVSHGPPMHGPDRLQVASFPTKYCSFSSNIQPHSIGPAQQPHGSAGNVLGVCLQEGCKFCTPCHHEPRFMSGERHFK